jgi:hypothetical protein
VAVVTGGPTAPRTSAVRRAGRRRARVVTGVHLSSSSRSSGADDATDRNQIAMVFGNVVRVGGAVRPTRQPAKVGEPRDRAREVVGP